jgi:hypothetical protein
MVSACVVISENKLESGVALARRETEHKIAVREVQHDECETAFVCTYIGKHLLVLRHQVLKVAIDLVHGRL